MAVPTVVRILPAGTPVGTPPEGPTAGRSLIEIYGSGFRIPPPVPADTGPQGPVVSGTVRAPYPETVRVTFGGVEATRVEVPRSNLLRVTTPVSPIDATEAENFGEGLVDVVITNLDDAGDPIPGEAITLVDAYTFRRVKLDAATASGLLLLVRSVIREWKRQVLPNVVLTNHIDYDADTSTPIVEIATMPAIVLSGPSLPENRFYSVNDPQDEDIGGGDVRIYRKPRTVDLLFDVIGISESTMELMNLIDAASQFVERNTRIGADADPSGLGYEFDFQPNGSFQVGSKPAVSNVRFFTGSIVIRGFNFVSFAGMPGDDLRGLATLLNDGVSLDVERTAG